MTRLYDIQQQIYDLLDEIALADGEITAEQEGRLEELHASREQKLKNYCRYFRNLDSDVEELEYEIDRLHARKRQMLDGRQRLLDHVGKMLGENGRFADVAGELKWNNPTGKAVLTGDIEQIPAEYKERIEEWSIDMGAIRAALKDGKQVPGAKLVFEKKMRFVAPHSKAKKARHDD